MKAQINHNNNVFSCKGFLYSSYIHHDDAYILLNAGQTCVLHLENEEERARVKEFIAQLQLGAYVFLYYTRNGRVIKIFDMLNGQVLDCEKPDVVVAENFSGILKFKTREFMRPNYEVYIFSVVKGKDARGYAYLVDIVQEEDDRFGLMKLQAGDEVSVLESKDGHVVAIKDSTRDVIIGKYE